jgi:general secretion pathway protein A
LRQLNQRITARYNLEPLNLDETGAYIRHRLEVAGMTPGRDVFPASVVRGIYKRTRGIPRLINVLCDRILLGAYGRNKTRADHSMLNLAAREVMGEPAPANAAWRWPAALVAVLLVALGVGGWWLLEEYGKQPAVASTAVLPSAAPPEATRPPVQEPAPIVSSLPPERIPEPTPEPEPVLELEAEAAVALAVEPGVVSRWLLPPGESMAQLWRLYSEQAVPENPCSDEVQGGVVCVEGQARTWDELAGFDRPLLLDMVTPERFSAAVLLLGLNGRSAWALTDRGVSQVSLAGLAPAWTGRYRFLWHPPQGFERPVALGDDSAVVEQVAELFARLDGQLRALADKKFNVALQQRVRLFQLEHKLDDDGVVGVQTLLRLNEQLGIDTTAAGARSQLQDSVSEMVQR